MAGAPRPTTLYGLGGNEIKSLESINCRINLKTKIGDLKLIILPDDLMQWPLILGRNFLQKFNIVLSQSNIVYTKKKLIQINKKMLKETSKQVGSSALSSNILTKVKRFSFTRPSKPMHIINALQSSLTNDLPTNTLDTGDIIVTDVPQIFAINLPVENLVLDIGDKLQLSEANQLRRIINECYVEPIEVDSEPYNYEMHIRLTSDVPSHCSPRRLSYLVKAEVQKTVEELLLNGVFRPSDSP